MAKGLSKAEFIGKLSEATKLSKREVADYLEAISSLVVSELKSSGEVTIPGLFRAKVAVRPETQDRMGVNPFTKQPMLIKGKPSRKVVKAAPVKALKDSV
jgi:DNA-binding protein HU-beta